MLANFHEIDHPSPAILISPLLTIADDTCLVLSLIHNASHLDFKVDTAIFNSTEIDGAKYTNIFQFGNQLVHLGSLPERPHFVEVPLGKGSYHVVLRMYANEGYVELQHIEEISGRCLVAGKYQITEQLCTALPHFVKAVILKLKSHVHNF